MKIESKEQALRYAEKYVKSSETLIVSVSGNVYINGVVDDVCSLLEDFQENYHILKGERIVKKAKK